MARVPRHTIQRPAARPPPDGETARSPLPPVGEAPSRGQAVEVADVLEQFRTLAENSPEVIARFDRQLRHTYVNAYGAKVYGVAQDRVVGKTNEELGMPPDKVAFWNARFEEVLATGRQQTVDFEFDSPAFGHQHLSSIFVPERDARGEVVSVLAITRDVTDLRKAEQALREADRRKDEFLGMLSHELRNPLAPIRNSIYILDHADPAGEQARRARAVLQRQTEHLTRLVDDLLDVTRVARGKIDLRRERVDLAAVVRRAADDLRSVMDQRGLTLTVNTPGRSVFTEADPTRIAQVMGNLLGNAAKFTPRGGRVTVTLATAGHEAEIRVRDTGVGIERALLPHVFEPFVQSQRPHARGHGGLGLGLALVKGLVELHHGSVSAGSAGPGTGAELVVRLPIESPAVPARADGGAAPAQRGRRVLIVDDDVDAADTLAQIVELFGHTAEVVHDGAAALARVREDPPDVVLCEIGLPGLSGHDVARTVRAEGPRGLRLVALSGYAQDEDLRRAVEAGFDTHVAKPADPAEIEKLLA
jgi:PAS domain S-box-containing protein